MSTSHHDDQADGGAHGASSKSSDTNENVRAYEALKRLSEMLKSELNDTESAPILSHYRQLPELVQAAYQMMKEGSQLVHSTSTKYTLVGKIDVVEGSKIALDLRQGCELVATGAMMLCNDDHLGMTRSARKYAKLAARSLVEATMQLIQVFVDETVAGTAENDVGSQRTGVVWEACKKLQQLPQGNRNAMRRDLFQWTSECNESMEEFQKLVDLGALQKEDGNGEDDNNDETTWDEFCEGMDDEKYSALELPVAQACVSIIKCSRGCMNLTLQACDNAGSQIDEQLLTVKDEGDAHNNTASRQPLLDALLWISKLHDLARAVGDGMTDFASLLYPPMEVGDLRKEMSRQVDSILRLLGHVLDSSSTVPPGHHGILQLSDDAVELAKRIRGAASARRDEALSSMELAISSA